VPHDWFVSAVTDANVQAWDAIACTLQGGGWGLPQIVLWQAGAAMQADIALYLIAMRARLDLDNEALASLAPIDRRKELLTLFPTDASGLVIEPPTNNPIASVLHGRNKSHSVFDEYRTRRGQDRGRHGHRGRFGGGEIWP